jgi:hypothetical protein
LLASTTLAPALEDLPALHRAIASGVLDDDDDIEVEFEFGLERILDGIGTLVASKRECRDSA